MNNEFDPNLPEQPELTGESAAPRNTGEESFEPEVSTVPDPAAQWPESAAFTTFFELPENYADLPATPVADPEISMDATQELPQIPAQPNKIPVHQPSMDDTLYHAQLCKPVVGEEITADENALYHAALRDPSDAQVDRILAETDLSEYPQQERPDDQPFMDQEYRDTFGENGEALAAVFDAVEQAANQAIPYDAPIPDYVEPGEEAEEPAQPEPEPEQPPRKTRPKMKKGYGLLGLPHVLATVIWLAITLAIGISLGRMIWVCAAEVLAFGSPDKEYVLTISDGDNIETIAAKLKNAGLIKYPGLFKTYADLTNAAEEISPGTFTLNSKFDYMALVNAMTYHSSAREVVTVVVPEGYSCAQIFSLLEANGVCTVAELEEYAANGEFKARWFLEDITRGDKYCLEGYLFPDTYEFYTNDEPSRVLGKFLDTFDYRFTDIMKERLATLNERMAQVLASRGYSEAEVQSRLFTFRDIVIIASMIEKETSNDAEAYNISSVIYNRLTNPANYPYLNIDATIIYALGGNIDPETGRTMPLTAEDLKLDSPYNTYTKKGMIPGPIANPGRNSLNAALDPTVTDFYFYVYNPNTSLHLFSKTPEEHQKNVDYVRSLEKQNEENNEED